MSAGQVGRVGRLRKLILGRRDTGEKDRGSEAVEAAFLLPLGLLVLAVIIVGARIALAGDRMSGVAGIAARDASIARSPAQAQSIATSSATDALSSDDLRCTDIRVTVDTSGFTAAPSADAVITVNVWCTVSLADISAPGLPGSRTLHDSATSPLDPARDLSLGPGLTTAADPATGGVGEQA